MYHYTKKMNGKKYTLATWTGTECTRIAECVFDHHGMKDGTVESETVTTQKMYAGNHATYNGSKFFTDTDRQAVTYFHNEIIYNYVQMEGSTEAMKYLLDLYQEDEEFTQDIRAYFKNS